MEKVYSYNIYFEAETENPAVLHALRTNKVSEGHEGGEALIENQTHCFTQIDWSLDLVADKGVLKYYAQMVLTKANKSIDTDQMLSTLLLGEIERKSKEIPGLKVRQSSIKASGSLTYVPA